MKRSIKIWIAVFLAFLVVFTISGMLFSRHMEGETIYADGYSRRNWEKIEKGMTKDEVFQILGQPLDYKADWGYSEGEEKWERLLWGIPKEGKGYFVCIWFDQNMVVRKQLWFDD